MSDVVDLYQCHQCHTFTAATGGSCLHCGALNLGPLAEKTRTQLQKAARRIKHKVVREMKPAAGSDPAIEALLGQIVYLLFRGKQ